MLWSYSATVLFAILHVKLLLTAVSWLSPEGQTPQQLLHTEHMCIINQFVNLYLGRQKKLVQNAFFSF